MKIDLHVHVAGVGTQGSGCWLSPSFRRRPVFWLLRRMQGISVEQMRTTVDRDWVDAIARQVRESELDRAVVLGFDGAYDAQGELDEPRSQLIVPPRWVFEACRRHPDALLPGPSINPFRRDATERLEECISGGAVLLKWLPASQDIDPASPRLRPFYRRLAEAGLPLLVHAGGSENTFREIAPELGDVRRLRAPLEQGVTVVCAHSGTRVLFSRDPDQLPIVRDLLEEFPNFWVDNSGMANPTRFPALARLARDPLFQERTLHGSDYPVPENAFYFPRRLGWRRVRELDAMENPFDRGIALKRALGYPEETLTRAARVLPTLRGRSRG
ncbi:MAG TPA: amidohydrolase family protein [Longimicrobiaceae bacterium]|nr:amidohydrolase family protein [Longimicrobiaceae bacterium]